MGSVGEKGWFDSQEKTKASVPGPISKHGEYTDLLTMEVACFTSSVLKEKGMGWGMKRQESSGPT